MTASGGVPLHHMARVSRMTAARSSGAGGGGIGGGESMPGSLTASQRGASLAGRGGKIDPTLSLYPSINTLRSEQEDDDFSYKDCCKTGQSDTSASGSVCVCTGYLLSTYKVNAMLFIFCLYTKLISTFDIIFFICGRCLVIGGRSSTT